MDNNINGVTCIKGEIHSIMTLMRLNTRWSQVNRVARDTSYSDEDTLVQSFRKLNEYLEGFYDLREVDCVMYIMPFHNVIISEKASGPLTSSALTALSKFALYGFLSEQCPRVQEGISLIANCISRCIFEETDWESDELILMKLLELSTLCYRCNASRLLTIASAWDMYNTCISIHNHYRASKILKSEAENALVHLTLSAFGRVLVPNSCVRSSRTNLVRIEDTDAPDEELKTLKDRSWESVRDNYNLSSEVGVTLLLGKIMAALSDMANLQKQSTETVKFSLVLINVALESGGPSLGTAQPLVDVLSNEVCRNLLRASQSDDLAIISLALRVVFNLFMSIKNHMKVQLEVFLISVHLRLINTTSPVHNANTAATASSAAVAAAAVASAKEELALESLLEFCREPSLMNDIYVNYDCDMQCTNLFDSIITSLCVRALPKTLLVETSLGGADKAKASNSSGLGRSPAQETRKTRATEAASPHGSSTSNLFGSLEQTQPSAQTGTGQQPTRLSIVNRLALDGVLAVLRSMAAQCSAVPTHKLAPVGGNVSHQKDVFVPIVFDAPSAPFTSLHHGNASNDSHYRTEGQDFYENGEGVDQQVDKWCESGSTSPTAEVLSQEDLDLQGYTSGRARLAPSSAQRQTTGSSLSSDSSFRAPSAGPNAVDGENEETVAVQQARAHHAQVLRERKLKKQKYKLAAEKFNKKPLKSDWVRFAMDLGILEPSPAVSNAESAPVPSCDAVNGSTAPTQPLVTEPGTGIDAAAIARFFRRTPGLGKTEIGEYISKGPPEQYPFNALVLREYVKTFDFSGVNSTFDAALRMFLGDFKLPGEAQCIDRIMEAFAGHLYEFLGQGRPFANADAAYILAFSTILLNTDLHNPGIPQSKKMTKNEFLRNNRGINDGKDLPQEYLENLYNEIKNRQIQLDIDMNAGSPMLMDFTDSTMWNKILHKGSADQAPAAFTSTQVARRNSLPLPLSQPCSVVDGAAGVEDAQRKMSVTSDDSLMLAPSPGAQSTHGAGAARASYERDLFLAMARPVLETLVVLYESAAEDQLVSRILQGLWDFITICSEFGLHQMVSDTVHLLSFRCKAMMEAERRVPTKPFTRRNILAHKAQYQQLRQETGVDLGALVSQNFDCLISAKIQAFSEEHRNEHGKFLSAGQTHTPLLQQPPHAVVVSAVAWSYAALIRGELLLRVVLQAASKLPYALQGDAWASTLMLLTWIRSRGALPPSLALVHDGFSSAAAQAETEVSFGSPGGVKLATQPLRPSIYAHRCYLEAYGLALERSGQSGGASHQNGYPVARHSNASASQSSGWLGFLFAAPTESSSHPHGMLSAPSGTLDLPNLYRNTNASVCVDMTGNPLRPDDEILKVGLEHCDPARLIFEAVSESGGPEASSLLLQTMLHTLSSMLEVLTAAPKMPLPTVSVPQRAIPAFKRGNSQTSVESVSDSATVLRTPSLAAESEPSVIDAVDDDENVFPEHMLSSTFVASDVRELDAVALLEWICNIVLKNEQSLVLFWSGLYEFLKLVLEENVDLMAVRCPYFLERCISVIVRASVLLVDARVAPNCNPAASGYTHVALTSSSLQAASALHVNAADVDKVWQALRLIRGVPSEVVANISDRLGEGVLELLRKSHSQGLDMSADRWFMLFSLLSAASSGRNGRPYVWASVAYLVDNDLIDDSNFTPCRHLVLRFAQGVFPGDTSEEQRNHESGAGGGGTPSRASRTTRGSASQGGAEDAAHVLDSCHYLMRLCLMALGGYVNKLSAISIANGSSGAEQRALKSKIVLQGKADKLSTPQSQSRTEIATFPLPSQSSDRVGRRNDKDNEHVSDKQGSDKIILLSPGRNALNPTQHGVATSGEKDAHSNSVSVRCIYFTRTEEVELMWLETCKIFAGLCGSTAVAVANRALYCLQTVLAAGSRDLFSDTLLLKVMGELAVKLPLNFAATVSRLSAAAPHPEGQVPPSVLTEATGICQRSYNLLFELVVQNIKQMRDTDDFLPIWTRFVAVLATNAHAARAGAPRSQQWWHDEMCDALEALLRLLRLPVSAVAAGSGHAATATDADKKSAVTPAPATSSGGFFGWFVAPLLAATDGPDVTGGIQHPDSVLHSGSSSLEEPPHIEPSDGFLLRLSWSHICSAYPTFPGSLRLRDPRLHARVSSALQLPEIYFQKNSARQKEMEGAKGRGEESVGMRPAASTPVASKPSFPVAASASASATLLVISSPLTAPPPNGDKSLPSFPEAATASQSTAHDVDRSPPSLPFPSSVRSLASPGTAMHNEIMREKAAKDDACEELASPVVKQAPPTHLSTQPTPPTDSRGESPMTPSPEKKRGSEVNVADRVIIPISDEPSEKMMMSPEFDTISLISTTSLMSPPFTHTPAKRPENMYDTPLADGKSALEFPTPKETPPVEPSHTPQTESAVKQAMPYVKNLTPIFASAEADRHQQDRASVLASSESKHVARKLEMGAATTPMTKAPAAPSDSPWQRYPDETPPVHVKAPPSPPSTVPVPAPATVSVRPAPAVARLVPTAPRSVAKGSRVQIV